MMVTKTCTVLKLNAFFIYFQFQFFNLFFFINSLKIDKCRNGLSYEASLGLNRNDPPNSRYFSIIGSYTPEYK